MPSPTSSLVFLLFTVLSLLTSSPVSSFGLLSCFQTRGGALDSATFSTSYTKFCSAGGGFQNITDGALDLTFSAATEGSRCGKADCLGSFESLMDLCQANNNRTVITGQGTTDTECGIFGFAIREAAAGTTGSATVAPGAGQTEKPAAVETTAAGKSGAGAVGISGGLMAVVAGVFFYLL